MENIEERLRKYSVPIIFVGIAIIILLDLIFPNTIVIEWPTVALIGLLIILPYVQYINRVRWRTFEAELQPQIEEAKQSARRIPDIGTQEQAKQKRDEVAQKLYRYLEEDPKVAIAMLGIELEKPLREIAKENSLPQMEHAPLTNLVEELSRWESDIITKDVYENLHKIQNLRNKAIHGGEISREDAKEIIDLGLRLLGYLYYYTDGPGDIEVINEPRY